ncbi:hypothetical protein MMC18_003668 [Xylographa bjoerkii]|nr:hypothetical protein [Xylographa bjoerkii]
MSSPAATTSGEGLPFRKTLLGRIPLELRDMIYELVLDDPVEVETEESDSHPIYKTDLEPDPELDIVQDHLYRIVPEHRVPTGVTDRRTVA